MKKILFIMFLSSHVMAQQLPTQKYSINDFMLIEKVENQEKKYNSIIKELAPKDNAPELTNDYRAELAFAWLAKGDVDRYKYYKSTKPNFSARQFLYLSNALENLFDEKKNYKAVADISHELLEEINKGVLEDVLGRTPIFKELNAAANAKLGNGEKALELMTLISTTQADPMREVPYFKDSKSNHLNRYAIVMSATGQNQLAFDVLSKAFKDADSNPYMVDTFKDVYKMLKGSEEGFESYLKSLKDEAYHKYYKEVEKLYVETPQKTLDGSMPDPEDPTEKIITFSARKPIQDIVLENLDGEKIALADHSEKILIIDFWTTLCTPCVASFSGFERVLADYSKEELQLFVIDLFETKNTVKAYVAQKGITLDVLHDEENAAYDVQATPTKIIFDTKGNIRFFSSGYAGSTDREYYKLKSMVEIIKNRTTDEAFGG